jgi:hypothetical protein
MKVFRALFTNAKNWKQAHCTTGKLWYIHIVEYTVHATMWLHLKCIVLKLHLQLCLFDILEN